MIDRNTPDQFGITAMQYGVYSDLYKDVYGFRPRGTASSFLSKADYDREFASLCEQLKAEQAAAAEIEAASVKALHDRIDQARDLGAISDQMAMQWILDAEDIDVSDRDYDYADWRLGVPYGTVAGLLI